ncbi:hypothetical protein CEXT_54751 [Caerostris extrusa]|uniref:Uncharacterized protein n=1 Tax=Caerostris extrusa TaxID=172846 RepID=A0AAV4MNB6_CAEEX|nr:hypothetical protein CEXT_54751 [Caerostris extrusa]
MDDLKCNFKTLNLLRSTHLRAFSRQPNELFEPIDATRVIIPRVTTTAFFHFVHPEENNQIGSSIRGPFSETYTTRLFSTLFWSSGRASRSFRIYLEDVGNSLITCVFGENFLPHRLKRSRTRISGTFQEYHSALLKLFFWDLSFLGRLALVKSKNVEKRSPLNLFL